MNISPAISNPTHRKILVLGPCSAESPEQLEALMNATTQLNPDLIRAGVWKPRTRPGHFQGKGAEALKWLVELKDKYNIPVCTEVANAEHVEACLKAGIDVLWIGARTTVNPFYVQEIADALKGTAIPIMIKNPLNPDLHLWTGAIERIYKAGIHQISAIHRGFSFYGNSIYRNVPRWQIPIELRRVLPEIQLIADISHISGSPKHLLEIAQIAMDLNFDGIMAELHPNPSEALSDADQQVTPSYFKEQILDRLIQRSIHSNDEKFNHQIIHYRNQINEIDHQLIELLSARMTLAEQIGAEKKNAGIAIFQPHRWDEIIKRLSHLADEKNLSQEFIFSLIEAIHIESIQHQSKKMNE